MIINGVKRVAWTIVIKFTGDVPSYAKDGEKIVYGIYVVIESYVKKD
ncbi:MAG: hypothetical protein M1113_00145 [Candidatus Thermoplasmatota archaeon]|nr:hypothetical protein [Candidatus Thermoplasmatota archaeon]